MPKRFSDCIREAIRSGPLTQVELARRLKVTQATISGLVTGQHFVGEDLLNGLARELGWRLVVDRRRTPKRS